MPGSHLSINGKLLARTSRPPGPLLLVRFSDALSARKAPKEAMLRIVRHTVACCFLFWLCAVSPAHGTANEVVAVALRDWPPQYMIDPNTGQPTGLAIDVMNRVAELGGFRVRYVVFDNWPEALECLEKNEAVLAPNMGITAQRMDLYDFTVPYETFRINAFVRNDTIEIDDETDLIGKTVGVVMKNQGQVLMKEKGVANLNVYRSLEVLFMALLSGEVDAIVYPEPMVIGLAQRSGLEDRIRSIGKPLQEIKRGIAVRKGEQELFQKVDASLRQFITTREYKALYEKWYGLPRPYWNVQRMTVVFGVGLAATATFLLIWRHVSIGRLCKTLLQTVAQLENTQQALKESEANYLDLYENAPDMYLNVDAVNGTIIRCNRTFLQASGYAYEDIVGRPFVDT